MRDVVLVLDFGSQYTQLIARRVRELGVYSEIRPYFATVEEIKRLAPKAIILSGGPASVYGKDAPKVDREFFNMDLPMLGICYGMQLMAHRLEVEVERSDRREYGPAEMTILDSSGIYNGITDNKTRVWMSHGDRIPWLPPLPRPSTESVISPQVNLEIAPMAIISRESVPSPRVIQGPPPEVVVTGKTTRNTRASPEFVATATSPNSPVASMRHRERPLYGTQFHPEVVHTPLGRKVLDNFVHGVAGCERD